MMKKQPIKKVKKALPIIPILLQEDRMVVLPDPAEEISQGGIIIPETAQAKSQKGTVLRVGPGSSDRPVYVKRGDRVIFGKYAGTEIEWRRETYLVMRQTDVMGSMEEEEF